jgi:hypothetical protein
MELVEFVEKNVEIVNSLKVSSVKKQILKLDIEDALKEVLEMLLKFTTKLLHIS